MQSFISRYTSAELHYHPLFLFYFFIAYLFIFSNCNCQDGTTPPPAHRHQPCPLTTLLTLPNRQTSLPFMPLAPPIPRLNNKPLQATQTNITSSLLRPSPRTFLLTTLPAKASTKTTSLRPRRDTSRQSRAVFKTLLLADQHRRRLILLECPTDKIPFLPTGLCHRHWTKRDFYLCSTSPSLSLNLHPNLKLKTCLLAKQLPLRRRPPFWNHHQSGPNSLQPESSE